MEIHVGYDTINRIRTGHCRGVVMSAVPSSIWTPIATDLGPATIINLNNENMKIEIEVFRISFVLMHHLDERDAIVCGLLDLTELYSSIRKDIPTVQLDTPVLVLHFERTDR